MFKHDESISADTCQRHARRRSEETTHRTGALQALVVCQHGQSAQHQAEQHSGFQSRSSTLESREGDLDAFSFV